MFINLIAQHHQSRMFDDDFRQLLQRLLRIHRPARVTRRAQNQQPRPRRDRLSKLFRRHQKSLIRRRPHDHALRPRQPHHLRITHPIRRRHQNLVPRSARRHHALRHALFRPVRQHDLRFPIVRQSVLFLELSRDRVSQFRVAVVRRVLRLPRVDGRLPRVADRARRREIRLARGETDDVLARVAHRAREIGQRDRLRRLQVGDAFIERLVNLRARFSRSRRASARRASRPDRARRGSSADGDAERERARHRARRRVEVSTRASSIAFRVTLSRDATRDARERRAQALETRERSRATEDGARRRERRRERGARGLGG